MEICKYSGSDNGLTKEEITAFLSDFLSERALSRVLIIPPDYSRLHSLGGMITNICYHLLKKQGCHADILVATGTHERISPAQAEEMFGDIPYEELLFHDFRRDVIKLGEVPADYVASLSEGLFMESIDVEVNRRVLDPKYDLILSVGQVVPHEVVGMANYTKNLFVGVGGASMINKSHMLGAVYGLERIMGKDHTPVREVFDYSLTHFLSERPVIFVQTVCTADSDGVHMHGLFIGDQRSVFEKAVALAQQTNIDFVDKGIRKCVVWLDPKEFQCTWIGNKSIYRSRMAIADGGELLILAPGIRHFGEDAEMDRLIRKYGYRGRDYILSELNKEENEDLRENLSAAAHMIHSSSDGRFRITYAVRDISPEEMVSVGYRAASFEEMMQRYQPWSLAYGYNKMHDGEEIYFIPNPALGLWINRERFFEGGKTT